MNFLTDEDALVVLPLSTCTSLLSITGILYLIEHNIHTSALQNMLASALKASRLSQVRNARGYASAAGKIGDKKVSMSPLEQGNFINYQVSPAHCVLCAVVGIATR